MTPRQELVYAWMGAAVAWVAVAFLLSLVGPR